ncbi:tetratricopeptide repeat protein [Spirochaeta cellobiosiphila]|uniref:tetratricopeptide repeat protein n=1 Tax=Spirochaeta cellobiosiphila TaxID=504483 RepID=UPI0003F539AE|nr:hypothetical protein [Spirochaeta cellobiosiphila]
MKPSNSIRSTEFRPLLDEAYKALELGQFEKAGQKLEQALQISFDDWELLSALKCVEYWRQRKDKLDNINDSIELAEVRLYEWKGFVSRFVPKLKADQLMATHAIQRWVFNSAIKSYESIIDETSEKTPEVRLKLGRLYKGIGDYEKAQDYLEDALSKMPSARVYAELADTYALIGQLKYAKVFFREAFFIGAEKIELEYLESGLIRKLLDTLKEDGYSGRELQEWVPVYGVLHGIFNIKRELKPVELGQLKQSIYSLNAMMQDNKEESKYIIPKLINRYFWLIDHYIGKKEDRSRINEMLKNIKHLDARIYQKYIN